MQVQEWFNAGILLWAKRLLCENRGILIKKTKQTGVWPLTSDPHPLYPQLPGHMQVRLQVCQNWEPREIRNDTAQLDSDTLMKWLKRLQFKLGQIEVQSSQATQF